MTTCNATGDIAAIAAHHFPGIVIQRNLVDAIAAWLIEHGAVTADDVPAIQAAANVLLAAAAPYLPSAQLAYPLTPIAYPSGLPRFPDSNPTSDGWSIVKDDKPVPPEEPMP